MIVYWKDDSGRMNQGNTETGAIQLDCGVMCPDGCGRVVYLNGDKRTYRCNVKDTERPWPANVYTLRNNRIEKL